MTKGSEGKTATEQASGLIAVHLVGSPSGHLQGEDDAPPTAFNDVLVTGVPVSASSDEPAEKSSTEADISDERVPLPAVPDGGRPAATPEMLRSQAGEKTALPMAGGEEEEDEHDDHEKEEAERAMQAPLPKEAALKFEERTQGHPLAGFFMSSSLGCPFLVVSDSQLVEAVNAPTTMEAQQIFNYAVMLIDKYEENRVMLITDFEGEMPGYGGELVTAAFLPTGVLETGSLRVRRDGCPPLPKSDNVGLLIDMRSAMGVGLVRCVMENEGITKLIWGADSDLTSLRYQVFPRPLNIGSRSVVDVQLGFSTPSWRLGMARALERVPAEYLVGLPSKKLPLGRLEATYAADDLHRIEVIMLNLDPKGGSYMQARAMTDQVAAVLASDNVGLSKLQRDLEWFERAFGIKRRKRAVEIARHIMAIRARGVVLAPKQEKVINGILACVLPALNKAGVAIPADLAFGN